MHDKNKEEEMVNLSKVPKQIKTDGLFSYIYDDILEEANLKEADESQIREYLIKNPLPETRFPVVPSSPGEDQLKSISPVREPVADCRSVTAAGETASIEKAVVLFERADQFPDSSAVFMKK